jgi:transcriptional regulator with XRE-family HTH domain
MNAATQTYAKRLGTYLRKARRAAALTQHQAIEGLGVPATQGWLSKVESGHVPASYELVSRLCRLYGVPLPNLSEDCDQCNSRPPAGFTCNVCGAS